MISFTKYAVVTMLSISLAQVTLAAQSLETFLASKEKVQLVITGINHGPIPEIWPPSDDLIQDFSKAQIVISEVDITNRQLMEANAKSFRFGGDIAANRYLSMTQFKEIRQVLLKKFPLLPLSEADLGEVNACGLGLWLFPTDDAPPSKTAATTAKNVLPYEFFFLEKARLENKSIVSLETDGANDVCRQFNKDDVQQWMMAPLNLEKDPIAKKKYLLATRESDDFFVKGDSENSFAASMRAIDFDEHYANVYLRWLAIRNINFVKGIKNSIQDNKNFAPIFIMIGNQHLHGKDGVLNLLKEDGFIVLKKIGEK